MHTYLVSRLELVDGDCPGQVLAPDPGRQRGVELNDVGGDLLARRKAQEVLQVPNVLDG